MTKATARTGNNALAYEHSEDHLLEFFSKAGSLFKKKGTYYGGESTAIELFKQAWRTGREETCMKLVFWLRDIRGGSGNRSGTRDILNWLAHDESGKVWLLANLNLIPEYGRWDDLFALYNTDLESDAMLMWAEAIKEGNALAAKWADPQDAKMRSFVNLTPKQFRKWIVNAREGKIVESLMCRKNWKEIDYSHVPSVAIGRYNKAFYKNDKDRYDAWRKSLVKVKEDGTMEVVGDVKAGAIYPHDLVRTLMGASNGWYSSNIKYTPETEKLVEAQFQSMPDYFDVTSRRIMPILDFSGSMYTRVSGSIEAIDVALGLGLYCSDRVGKDNPFYRKVIPFSSNAKFAIWDKMTFAKAAEKIPDGYCGSTNIASALDLILDSAKMWNLTQDQIPTCLCIISDMQWNEGVENSHTPIENALKRWTDAGFKKPQIVYWNLMGVKNQPATKFDKNVALVSGFSPSIMKAVLEGEDFTPIAIMMKTLEKYQVVAP